jgi:hypothetical protein
VATASSNPSAPAGQRHLVQAAQQPAEQDVTGGQAGSLGQGTIDNASSVDLGERRGHQRTPSAR